MSYILDALRKADAERDRERALPPGLHAQTRPIHDPQDEAPPRPSALRLWGLAMLGVAGLALLAWRLWSGPEASVQAPVAAAPAALSPVPAALPGASHPRVPDAAVPPAVVPVSAPATAPDIAPAVPPARPPDLAVADSPRPAPTPVASAQRVTDPVRSPALPPLPAPQRTLAQPGSARTGDGPAPSIPRVSQLPEAQRRGLPPLQVSGSVYSPDADRRMVILDGQVVREGHSIQPGLVVERIEARAVILTHQGQRFVLPF